VADPRPLAALDRALAEEAGRLAGGEPPAVELTRPARPEHGDLATSAALVIARQAGRPPREIAEQLAAALAGREDLAGAIERMEVAGPGFLNITLTPAWLAGVARAVAQAGERYGAGSADRPERILIEFVSANPTGAPHVGHARQAAYGDSLARLLAFAGHTVTREFYVNDHGRQMELFGASAAARYAELMGLEAEVPEGGYRGEEVRELATALRAEVGDRYRDEIAPPSAEALAFFVARGGALMLEAVRLQLDRFRVRFDRFFSERTLHEGGAVARGIARLEAAGHAYRAEGALWFRASAFGDEKDRVLVRADGDPTYLAADVAYHLDKAGRGQDRLINVLGADHHGYVPRLRALLQASGYDPDILEVPIVQLVSLLERGEAKKMSKRAGTLVTLSALLDDVGVDAARFFLLLRSHETPLELDLDLAREASQENPVYYVQYAHARVAGILAQIDGAAGGGGAPDPGPPATLDPSERALVLRLAEWPDAVAEAELRRAPHRVVAYLRELAHDFHTFYHRCRVVGEAPEVERFRLDCCRATAAVVRTGLGLVGVDAPDRM
jgi:arginyl-tRNA synthetase